MTKIFMIVFDRPLIMVAALFFLVPPASAVTDLWQVYEMARQNDPQFQEAFYAYQSARMKLPLAKSQYRPSIQAGADVNLRRDDFSAGSLGTRGGTFTEDRIQLSLDQVVYDRGKLINIDQAEIAVRVAGERFLLAQLDLIERTTERYFLVLGAQDNVQVKKLQKKAFGRQLDLAKERLEVGLGTQTDYFDAKARYERANAELIDAEVFLNDSRQALLALVGRDPGELAPLREDAPIDPPDPNMIDPWVSKALAQNVELQAQNLLVQIASREIDKQRSTRLPTVGFTALGYSAGTSDRTLDLGLDEEHYRVGLGLNWPFYLGGSIRYRTEEAGYNFNAEEQKREALRRQIEAGTRSAFLTMNSRISQVRARLEEVNAQESALKAKEEGYDVGLTTNIEVLNAQRDLGAASTNYLKARYDYILDVIRLEKIAATLDEEDVRRINTWLDRSPSKGSTVAGIRVEDQGSPDGGAGAKNKPADTPGGGAARRSFFPNPLRKD